MFLAAFEDVVNGGLFADHVDLIKDLLRKIARLFSYSANYGKFAFRKIESRLQLRELRNEINLRFRSARTIYNFAFTIIHKW